MTNTGLVNLNFYSFMLLENLPELRVSLKKFCLELNLQGTILIAPEGLNVAVTGTPEALSRFKDYMTTQIGVQDPPYKEAPVDRHSFKRMLVKIKKEIIPVGAPHIRPSEKTGKRISPSQLKQWLDEKRDFILLDTRNNYEIDVGTFEKAEHFGLDHSREFTDRVKEKLDYLKSKPVVTFCTGGIRCEKGSAVLMDLGLDDVYQLDGGILKYFEAHGSNHFKGNCFVFDWRLAVDGKLESIQRAEDKNTEFGRHRSEGNLGL